MADTLVVFLKVFFKQRFNLNKKSAGDDKSIKNINTGAVKAAYSVTMNIFR